MQCIFSCKMKDLFVKSTYLDYYVFAQTQILHIGIDKLGYTANWVGSQKYEDPEALMSAIS